MRGLQDKQTSLWAVISIEERIPSSHPLRGIKTLADQRLVDLSRVFNRMYSQVGRPSIAPERILKSLLLIALYSVRSERQFCEQLDYNLLFRWFLDMNMIEERKAQKGSPMKKAVKRARVILLGLGSVSESLRTRSQSPMRAL